MIAVDTNVLLRYLLEDDQKQLVAARRVFNGEDLVLVTDVVLVETLWTLRGKKYELKKKDIETVVLALFEEQCVCFENAPVVWNALQAYRSGKTIGGKHPDFPDALIVEKARHIAEQRSEEFHGVATFDKAAQRLTGTFHPDGE